MSGAGDVNGDTRDDIIAGAHLNDANGTAAGMARVLGLGGTTLFTFLGTAAGDEFGRSVSGAGDVDGDGRADVIVGAPQTIGGGRGYARIFSGLTGGVIRTLSGIDIGSAFGISVAGVGDVNADGFDDVTVGAFQDDTPGISRGRAYVYSGLDGSVLLTLTLSNALENTTSTLVIGFSQLGAPLLGGTLVPAPDLLVSGLSTGPSGSVTLAAAWPAGVPSQAALFFQHWIGDPAAPFGLAASNGLSLVTP